MNVGEQEGIPDLFHLHLEGTSQSIILTARNCSTHFKCDFAQHQAELQRKNMYNTRHRILTRAVSSSPPPPSYLPLISP